MNKLTLYLIGSFVVLSMLASAGPVLIGLINAAVPLILVLGIVVCTARLVWHYTSRDL